MARMKYHNRKVKYDGIEFDSRKEMQHYIRLKSMQADGLITELRLQVPYEIIPAVYEEREIQLKTKTKFPLHHTARGSGSASPVEPNSQAEDCAQGQETGGSWGKRAFSPNL